jgi:hypothetical protein
MTKVGRNEACPCGSGKKYKQCCESKAGGSLVQSRVIMFLIAAAIVAAILAGFSNGRSSPGSGVWSAEHGHYHDANGRETGR